MRHNGRYNRRIFALLLTFIVLFSSIPIYGSGIRNGEQYSGDAAESAKVFSQSEYTPYPENKEAAPYGDESIVEIDNKDQKNTIPESGISVVEILKSTPSDSLKRGLMSFETTVDDVKITVKAKEGVIPEEAELFAEAVEDDGIREDIREAVKEKRSKAVQVSESFLYDISLLLDGEEYQPEGKVTVTFLIPGERDREQKPCVFHVLSDKETEKITGAEVLPLKNTDHDIVEEDMTEVSA